MENLESVQARLDLRKTHPPHPTQGLEDPTVFLGQVLYLDNSRLPVLVSGPNNE